MKRKMNGLQLSTNSALNKFKEFSYKNKNFLSKEEKFFEEFRKRRNFKKKLIKYLLGNIANKQEIISKYNQAIQKEEFLKEVNSFNY